MDDRKFPDDGLRGWNRNRGKLTSPRWKNFKGMKLRWKDKIRLNNVIWRAWHMQFVQRRRPTVCTFASPVEDSHIKPEAVVLEGKYWKRQVDTVRAEYKSWRVFTQKSDLRRSGEFGSSEMGIYDWQPRSNQSAYSCSSMLVDDDTFGDYTDTLFSCLIPSHPFPFPNPREIARAGIADFIQPGLVQFQPNLDDFMDTFDVLSQKLPPVFEEDGGPVPSMASSASISSSSQQQQQSVSGYLGMDYSAGPPPPSTIQTAAPPGGAGMAQRPDLRCSGLNFQSKLYSPSNGITNNSIASSLRNSVPTVPMTRFASSAPISALDTAIAMDSGGLDPKLGGGGSLIDLQLTGSLIKEEDQNEASPADIFALTPATSPASVYLYPPTSPPQLQQASPTERHSPLQGAAMPDPASQQPPPLMMHAALSPSNSTSPPRLLPLSPPQNAASSKYVESMGAMRPPPYGYSSGSAKVSGGMFQGSMMSAAPQPPPPPPPPPLPPPQHQSIGPIRNTVSDMGAGPLNGSTVLRRSSIGYDKGGQKTRKDDDVFVVPKPKARTRSRSGPSLGHLLSQQQQASRTSPPVVSSHSAPTPIAPSIAPSQTSIHGCGALLAQLLSTGPYSSAEKVNVNRNSSPTSVAILPNTSSTAQAIVVTPVTWPTVTSVNNLQNQVLVGATSQVFGLLPPPGKMALPPSSTMNLTTSTSTLNSIMTTASSLTDNLTSTSPKPFRPKSDTERKQYREHRRVCHINAEQKRRCNIKNGFDMLHHLVPCLSHSPNAKVSKAAMLQKAGEYIKQLKVERAQLQEEAELLKKQIENLNQAINLCQSQLPATGAPVPCQRPNKLQKMFEEYVKERILQNWKFWLFSRLIQPLLESYNNTVSTASVEDLCKTVLTWLEQHCSLVSLRPVVFNSLRHLTTTTNILTDPGQIRAEAEKDVN